MDLPNDTAPTSTLESLEDAERAERIMALVREAVEWSFRVRPMQSITKAEARRRLDLSWSIWKELLHTGGYEALNAARAIPALLVEVLDRAPPDGMESYIKPVTGSLMVPLDGGRRIVTPERTLSALAANRGTMPSPGPVIVVPGERRKS